MLHPNTNGNAPAITTVAWIHGEMNELASGLNDIGRRIAKRFFRKEPRARAMAYLRGLLSQQERKTSWQLAEEAGDRTPEGMQRLLNAAKWDADGVRDDLQDYVVEHLGELDAVLPIDETGFVKKGFHSVGVQRQYTGTSGKIDNCQVGVFLSYLSSKGRALIDRALYMPKSWTDAPDRCYEAQVPDPIVFKTKPDLAREMLAHAFKRGVPAAWVTGDEVYGRDAKLRHYLEDQRKGYVLTIPKTARVPCGTEPVTAAQLARELPAKAWKRLSAGDGTKGPRDYDWAWRQLDAVPQDGFAAWLLVRRSLGKKPEMTYYRVFAPVGTRLPKLAEVAGSRWSIEECFERSKGEVGLDDYEVRLWPAWYRHMTLSMFALAYLDVVRAHNSARHAAAEKGALEAGGRWKD